MIYKDPDPDLIMRVCPACGLEKPYYEFDIGYRFCRDCLRKNHELLILPCLGTRLIPKEEFKNDI